MNRIAKTHGSVSTVCNVLSVLLFAAFVDATSVKFINLVCMTCF